MSLYAPAGAALGLLLGLLLWWLLGPIMASPLLARKNFRDRDVITASGLIFAPLALIQATAAALWFGSYAWGREVHTGIISITLLTLPLVLFGLLDDLIGDGSVRGLFGHIRSALNGQITTGMLKLSGISMTSVWVAVVAVPNIGGSFETFRVALVLALSANLGNLFDLAPGRATKVSVLVWIPVVALNLDSPELFGPSLILGGALALLVSELGEHSMLGDSGANVLGAAIGLCLVVSLSEASQWVAAAVCLFLTLASERVSFSKLIRSVPPLNWLDLLGRESLSEG